jgi:hypothetical protein
LLVAAMGAGVILLAAWAFGSRRLVRTSSGRVIPEPSDLMRLFGPLLVRPMRSRGGRERLAQKLDWARIGFFTPETWLLANLLAGPLAFLLTFLFFSLISGNGLLAVIMALVAGAAGFIYPRTTLSRRLRARQARIKRDVVGFISLYARTATVLHDTTLIFAKMLEIAARENADRTAPAGVLKRSAVRRRRTTPYSSDLWLGLEIMMRERAQGIHRKGASYERPDPLISFAFFCDEPAISTFIDRIRQARDQQRHITPEQLDIMVANLEQHGLQEVRRGFADLVAKAIIVLVAFGMPLIFTAVGASIIYALFNSFPES